ncbi:sugar kinase, partial [Mesorhizobium sp. M7A.F.Ca.CA.001.16.1.1]
ASATRDGEAAVIEGGMPKAGRRQRVDAIIAAIATIDGEGLKLPAIREGTVGIHARALGGASLPLSERFLIGSTTISRSA